ncbi:MAG: radical SAM protein [Deltaproteobacteria bacterium]|nr:radical SAM protein [Deltaproteobacteria bacterium]
MCSKSHAKKSTHENRKMRANVSLKILVHSMIDFLERFGDPFLMGKEFYSVIGQGDGEKKLYCLLEAVGYQNDPESFFNELLRKLSKTGRKKIAINNLVMPHLLLVSVLEKIMPGNGLISIKNTDNLEKAINANIPENTRKDLQKVIETYPVRLSMHIIRQAAVSNNVASQYLPFVEELDAVGHIDTWVGQFQKGILEQMYQNRVVFLLNMSCPVYCRFCFRKHKDSRKAPNPSTDDVKAAVEHVRKAPSVKEVLITGGDPFLSRENLECAIDGLMKVPHVQTLRLATRSIAYYPYLFLADDSACLRYLKQKNLALQDNGKCMEVATHFIHPDEISPESIEIILNLRKNGINVYVQTPILKNCNDKGLELIRLFRLLRGAGAELHYIFTPCSPIHGNSIYRTSISKGMSIAGYLRAHLSDRAIPKISTATPIGKVEWHTSGWAVEQDKDNKNFIWIRTSYTPGYFNAFAPLANELENIRINKEGTIDIRFMATIGDDALFLGSMPPRPFPKKNINIRNKLEELKSVILNHPSKRHSIVETGLKTLSRLHETRVEINAEAGEEELDYIQKDDRITDVVILLKKNDVESILEISSIIKKLYNIRHVNAVRLRSMKHNYTPTIYTPAVINKLGTLNKLTIVNPQRIEIETQFITADEIKPEHRELTRSLNNRGITVYNNTPLLGGINDSPDEIQNLAFLLRQAGVEFHHLYVSGLTIQNKWNKNHPVDMFDIIDIAARIRRDGSGREIPRYMIRTFLGEADYGLTSSFINNDGQISVKLPCYDMAYFKSMNPDFSWPENVTTDKNEKPIIPVSGLIQSISFPI